MLSEFILLTSGLGSVLTQQPRKRKNPSLYCDLDKSLSKAELFKLPAHPPEGNMLEARYFIPLHVSVAVLGLQGHQFNSEFGY